MTRVRSAALLLAGLVVTGALVDPARAVAQFRAPVTVTTPGGEVTITADRLEEIGPKNLLIATGNVEITRGRARLLADRVEVNRATGDAVAVGRVIFYEGEDRLTGQRIEYNLRTGTGVVYEGEAEVAPYYRLRGARLERLDPSRYRVRQGIFTTCEDDPPTWSFRFGSATAELDEWVYGTGGSFWVKNVPLIPLVPFFAAALRRERQSGFLFPRLGSSSRRGLYAEVPFFWAISDSQDATITFNAYSERGFGGSAEYRWVFSAEHRGSAAGFYLKETEREPVPDRDDDRGWWRLRDRWDVGPGLAFQADINGVSDDFVVREYGDRLHDRSAIRAESNVFLSRSWTSWNVTGNLLWYQDLTQRRPVELQRLPDLRLGGVRQPVPGLPGVLYEVEASATRFVRDVGSDGGRVDVHPRLSRPVSVAGVTLTPFVGGRVTAYDRTVTGTRVTRSGGLTVEETDDDPRVRRLVEAGADLELMATRRWDVGGRGGFDALLHTVEPRVTYTWIEGSDLSRLPRWTDVDDIRRTSQVSYSLVNRLRARTPAAPGAEAVRWELARLTLSNSLDLGADDRPLGNVVGDLIVDTNRLLRFRGDASLDVYGGGLRTATTDLGLRTAPVTASVGTRFDKADDVNFLEGSLSADLGRRAVGRFSTDWDLETDTFVENRFALDLKWQCWALTIEYVARNRDEDELRFAVNLLGVGAPITTGTGLGALTGRGAR